MHQKSQCGWTCFAKRKALVSHYCFELSRISSHNEYFNTINKQYSYPWLYIKVPIWLLPEGKIFSIEKSRNGRTVLSRWYFVASRLTVMLTLSWAYRISCVFFLIVESYLRSLCLQQIQKLLLDEQSHPMLIDGPKSQHQPRSKTCWAHCQFHPPISWSSLQSNPANLVLISIIWLSSSTCIGDISEVNKYLVCLHMRSDSMWLDPLHGVCSLKIHPVVHSQNVCSWSVWTSLGVPDLTGRKFCTVCDRKPNSG